MGEAPKLTHDESVAFARAVLRRIDGAVPVVVGVSLSGLDNLVQLSRDVMGMGAAGVMVSPATGLRTEDQAHGYFAKVFGALGPDVPVCLQDYPPASGVFLSVETLQRLFEAYPQIAVFKHEDSPGLAKLSRLRAASGAGGRRIAILTGNFALHLPQELARGAAGVMSGFAFPEMPVGVCARFAAGDADGAEDLFDAYLPLVRHEAQRNPLPARRDEIAGGPPARPRARRDRPGGAGPAAGAPGATAARVAAGAGAGGRAPAAVASGRRRAGSAPEALGDLAGQHGDRPVAHPAEAGDHDDPQEPRVQPTHPVARRSRCRSRRR